MHIVCPLTIIPVRAEPSDKSEMVTQMLFGESAEILEERGPWSLIRMHTDGYLGWIDRKQVLLADDAYLNKCRSNPLVLTTSIFTKASFRSGTQFTWVLRGSTLPLVSNNTCLIGTEEYQLEGMWHQPPATLSLSGIANIAEAYLNTPYLWGGRSVAGIDCSGFVQAVIRECGFQLPRDAAEQAHIGETIDFIDETKEGDLAFFHNSNGGIIHAGIILDGGKIIHASGRVRIDTIDHHGIFNHETRAYSHSLRIIKRLS